MAKPGPKKRPTRKKILHSITNSFGVVSDVARILGVSRNTAYKWIEEDEEFVAALEAARMNLVRGSLGALVNAIREGETRDRITAAKYILSTIGRSLEPAIFGEQPQIANKSLDEQARGLVEAVREMEKIDRGN